MKTNKIKSVLKLGKSALPVANTGIQVGNGVMFTNLTTWIRVERKVAPLGNKVGIDARGMFDTGQKLDEGDSFPVVKDMGDHTGTIDMNPKIIEELVALRVFTGSDSLRPIFDGININKTDFAATDAHILRYYPHELELEGLGKEGFTLSGELIQMIDQDAISLAIYYHFSILRTKIDGYETFIYSRNINEKFPNYKTVIPQVGNYGEYKRAWEFTPQQLKDSIADWERVSDSGLYPTLLFNDEDSKDSSVHAITSLVDDVKYYPIPFEGKKVVEAKVNRTIIMPVMLNQEALGRDYDNKYTYGLNLRLLLRMSRGASSIRVYPNKLSNRACMVELDFCKPKKTVTAAMKLQSEIVRLQGILDINKIKY